MSPRSRARVSFPWVTDQADVADVEAVFRVATLCRHRRRVTGLPLNTSIATGTHR